MEKYAIWLVAGLVVVIGAFWIIAARMQVDDLSDISTTTITKETNDDPAEVPVKTGGTTKPQATPKPSTTALAQHYSNATYTIEGVSVKLLNGVATVGGVTTKIEADEAMGDLNGDLIPDVAVWLTQTGSGSGTFYYVAAATKSNNGYRGTNAVYVGDRIFPKPLSISGGEIVANYNDRALGEAMSVTPIIPASKYLHLVGGTLRTR